MRTLREILRRTFIPGRSNNHHPTALSHAALTAYVIIAFASFVVLRNISVQTNNVLGFATDVSPERIIELTNQERSNAGLSAVAFDAQLTLAAHDKARDMFEKGYWAHFGPNGESPWTFVLGAGYQYEYAGENLAKNFMDSGAVVQAWMNSPTHRSNVLNGNYRDIGVAVVNGNLSGEDTTLVVEMFGSKSALAQNTQTTRPPEEETLGEGTTPIPVRARVVTKRDTPSLTPPLSPTSGTSKTQEIVSVALPKGETQLKKGSYINLFPAFRFVSASAIAILILIFVIDLYHLSRTPYHHHRGKHLVHILFLFAILIGIYYLGKGTIL